MKTSKIIPLIIAALSIGGFMATDIYLPSFPALRAHFMTSVGAIQLSMSLFLVAFAIAQFFWGMASDRFGRKPVLLVGLVIFILGSIATLIPGSIHFLYGGRILQGLGIGAAGVICRVIIRDSYSGKALTKMFSIVGSIVVIAPAVAPFIGGYLQSKFDYTGSFFAMLLYGIFLLGLILCFYRESNLNKDKHATNPTYVIQKLKLFVSEPRYLFSVFTNGFVFSMVLAYSMITPFIFQAHFGVSPIVYGYLILGIALGLFVGTFSNIFLLNYFKAKNLVRAGLSLSLIANLSLLLIFVSGHATVMSISICLFVMNIGVTAVLPNMLSKIFGVFQDANGLVGAFYGTFRMLIPGLIGLLISLRHIADIEQMCILLLVINGVSILTYVLSDSKMYAKILFRRIALGNS